MAICTAIEKISDLPGGNHMLQVTIDNLIKAYWIADYSKALEYLNKEVIVEYRDDIYKGNFEKFIDTFIVPKIVNTLDQKDNFKLFLDQEDNIATVAFNEIEVGDERLGCIVFCTHSCYKASSKATWMELTIRDRCMKVSTLRLFNYENKDIDYSGKYIKTSLLRNQFGFQSELIKPLNDDVYVNPEIALAKQFILNYFASDAVALKYIETTHVLDKLEAEVDYEAGYGLMRLAMELSMVDSLENISNDVCLRAIGQALLCSRGYLTTASALSNSYTNISVAFNYQFPERRYVMRLLDESLEEKPKEYVIMKQVKEMVNTILEVRKGTTV